MKNNKRLKEIIQNKDEAIYVLGEKLDNLINEKQNYAIESSNLNQD